MDGESVKKEEKKDETMGALKDTPKMADKVAPLLI